MKFVKFLGFLLIILGLCAAVVTGCVALKNMEAEPVLLKAPAAAESRVKGMMDSFCSGDYVAAEKMLLGNTRLGVDREAADPVGQLLWQTFQSNMSYELLGELYATNDGLAQNIRITTLDLDPMIDYIETNTKLLLEAEVNKRLDNNDRLDEIYDDNNEYREEFVAQFLMDAAQQAVQQEKTLVQTELTLYLTWENGTWWVVPNDQLLGVVSAGLVG